MTGPSADASDVNAGGPPRGRLVTSPVMLLAGIGRIARDRIDTRLAADGLSLRHLGVLGHLRHTPGLSYSELARRAGVTTQSMQATVAQLEADGRVARDTPPGRGRTARLRVTSAGDAALRRAEASVSDIENTLLAPLGPDDRAALARLLLPVTMAVMGIDPPGRPAGRRPPSAPPPGR